MTCPAPAELDSRLLPVLHATLEAVQPTDWTLKPDGSQVTELDHALQQAIIAALQEVTPQYPVLGEEMEAVQQSRIFEDATTPFWVRRFPARWRRDWA